MANIKDVAKHAGVSPATVSRVLTKNVKVKKETEMVVLQSIAELNYSPNILAQRMRQQRTLAVNVIVPDIANPFFCEILRGIELVAHENGYQVYIIDINNDACAEQNYISALAQRQVDGIISLSAATALKTIESMSQGFPIVIAVQYFEDSTLPNVGIDNVHASKDIVKHLISLGHRKIAYITTSPELSLYRDRMTGYLQALAESGIPIDMNKVFYADSASMSSGYNEALKIIEDKSVSAICAAGDCLAIGAIKAIKGQGLSIPRDLSIVGFDDIDYAEFCDPGLTTVQQPRIELGKQSMLMLLNLINGTPGQTKKILNHKIVVRGSTAELI